MSFTGIVQIETADSDAYVNQKLDLKQGWELLAITAGKEGPIYTVGRREVKKDPLAGLTAGAIARANNLS
jgi:hypothetical protein